MTLERNVPMLNDNQTMNRHRMPIGNSRLLSAEPYLRLHCRTRMIMGDFYLCQNNQCDCEHASPFGASYLCWSPDRCEYSKVSS